MSMSGLHQHHTGVALSVMYAMELMSRPSVTPKDAGCQEWLAKKLTSSGFTCHHVAINGVKNLVAEAGSGPVAIAFSGHTDVVPPGPLKQWRTDPFNPCIVGDELVGRGAADMKTGIAAMLAATERVLKTTGIAPNKRFMWLITSDEEGEAEFGSKEIKQFLDRSGIQLRHCLVGEPTANVATGDAIRTGRRGAISGRIRVYGRQGHVAYPQFADNAIHTMARVIDRLNSIKWDAGSDDFPGTGLQITHIDSGEFTDNIVPATCTICFNIRYSHRFTRDSLNTVIERCVAGITEQFDIQWQRACEPYFTEARGAQCLIAATERAICKNTGKFPVLSTAGGTSDGRFFAGPDTQVVELGVPNRTIHQVNERVRLSDVVTLESVYTDLLTELLS